MFRRKSDIFFVCLAVGTLLIGLMFLDAAVTRRLDRDAVRQRR